MYCLQLNARFDAAAAIRRSSYSILLFPEAMCPQGLVPLVDGAMTMVKMLRMKNLWGFSKIQF